MARREEWTVGFLTITGSDKKGGVAKLIKNQLGDALWASGLEADLPDGKAGYALGCQFICTDSGEIFYNMGTRYVAYFRESFESSSSSSSSLSSSSSSSSLSSSSSSTAG